MSWDVILFHSKQQIKSIEDLDDNELEPIDFCEAIEKHFPYIIKDENHREIKGSDHSIEYFHSDEPSSNMIFNLYGQNGIYAMIDFAKEHSCQIYDTGLDDMLDLENPAKNGYKDFQQYLTQVLKK